MQQNVVRDISRLIRALLIASVAMGCAQAGAQTSSRVIQVDDLRDLEQAFVRLSERVRPSAVSVRTYNLTKLVTRGSRPSEESRIRMPRSHGSGAIIGHDGYILTSAHVIEGADEITAILHDGREFDADLVQADQRSDLAVIKIDTAGLRPVAFKSVNEVRVGQWCFVVGNPFGLSHTRGTTTVTYGIVSALEQDLSDELNSGNIIAGDERYYGNLIQTSAAINPGNSGGPLFNIDGQMIGVVTAIESRSGVTEGCGFAIPMCPLSQRIVSQLRKGETVSYGYLGIQFARRDTIRRGEGRGVRIGSLRPENGPAAKAGLRPDDLIIELNGERLKSKDHLIRVVAGLEAGKKVPVTYLRDGRRRTASVTMGERLVNQVAMGDGGEQLGQRTCYWRGAWLSEPSDAQLRMEGVSRERTGLVVFVVEAGSEAEEAGLEPAQMILALNRKRVRSIDEFLEADQKAGKRVNLQVHTADGTKTVRMPRRDSSL
jgi:serine protease Do